MSSPGYAANVVGEEEQEGYAEVVQQHHPEVT